MMTLLNDARAVHRFLTQYAFYGLVFASALAGGLLLTRVYILHSWTYAWLVWNLALAWLPYLWSLVAALLQRRYPRRPWALLVPGALWLLFFPNAPYIITDLMHLNLIKTNSLWFDVALLATFAWAGCFLGVISLRIMQTLVEMALGKVAGWLFVLGATGLGGLGIFLGRFHRWNSWDVLVNPRGILYDVLYGFLHPVAYPRALGVSVIFAAFFLACYLTFTTARPVSQVAE